MPTPAKLTKDKAAAVALRPETVEFFARVKAFLGQRQESERLYAELCAAAPEAARRIVYEATERLRGGQTAAAPAAGGGGGSHSWLTDAVPDHHPRAFTGVQAEQCC